MERELGFRVVAEAANGREAVVLAEYRHPVLILLDIRLPDVSGIAAAREIFSRTPNTSVIFVTGETDGVYVCEAFKAGARGYVSVDSVQTDLAPAIYAVARGHHFVSSSISRTLLDECERKQAQQRELSESEKELRSLLTVGYKDQEIEFHLRENP